MNMVVLYSDCLSDCLSVCLSVSLSLSLSLSLSEGYKFEANQINCVLTGSLRIQSNNALSAIT